MSNTYTALKIMQSVYQSSLKTGVSFVEPPVGALKVPLHIHQKAVLYAMDTLERNLNKGMDCSNEILYSSYGILGDSVGVGKSLMVMGHVARLFQGGQEDPIQDSLHLHSHSNGQTFSFNRIQYGGPNEAGCLLIVPHTLYRQWANYIKSQSSLKALLLERKKAMEDSGLRDSVLGAQIVLISNTLYRDFSYWMERETITWKRVFIDEADTIAISSTCIMAKSRFTWLISASWMNLLFPNATMYCSQVDLNKLVFNPHNAVFSALKPYFIDAFNSNKLYHYFRFNVNSYGALRNILSSDHPHRGRMVIRCDDSFVNESISLPPLKRTNIYCRAPIQNNLVLDSVSQDVQQLLHAGDTAGAIQALGLRAEESGSIVEAVTRKLRVELDRLKEIYGLKSALTYSSAAAKESALESLREKIRRAESSIASLQERIEGFKEEMCPICYDEPGDSALLTPCCSRIFCGTCILQCLARSPPTCPMCRQSILPSSLKHVVSKERMNTIVESGTGAGEEDGGVEKLEKKSDALLRIFKENPDGRFLVFSRFDNPFEQLETQMASLKISVKQMKGNKDAVANTLKGFQSGAVRCLLLNSHYAGSGLNITAATHVILLHAMTHEEEKQILGRAYRLGRSEPLQFIRLLHENEATNAAV